MALTRLPVAFLGSRCPTRACSASDGDSWSRFRSHGASAASFGVKTSLPVAVAP